MPDDIDLDAYLDDMPSDEHTLLARIPVMSGSSKKMSYLAFRSAGFNITKSCELAGCSMAAVHQWRKSDPLFKEFESEKLHELQATVGPDIIKYDFMRVMKMFMHQDFMVVSKAITGGLEALTPREYDVYKNTRQHYSPAAWLSIEKVLAPEKHQNQTKITVNLSYGSRSAEIDGYAREIPDELEAESREIEDESSNLLGM